MTDTEKLKHGRLIDADVLKELIYSLPLLERSPMLHITGVMAAIDATPTVVEGERAEEMTGINDMITAQERAKVTENVRKSSKRDEISSIEEAVGQAHLSGEGLTVTVNSNLSEYRQAVNSFLSCLDNLQKAANVLNGMKISFTIGLKDK